MATRNKTAAFLKQRNSIRQSRPKAPLSPEHVALNMAPHAPGLRHGGGYVELTKLEGDLGDSPPGPSSYRGTSKLPPQWVDVSEKVKEDMAKIRTKMTELGKAQARALLPTFGPDTEKGKKTEHEARMEVLTAEITRMLKTCEQRLHRLPTDSGSDSNAAICRNIQRCMATDLQTLSMEFRKQSKQYLKRLQEQQQPRAQTSSAFSGVGSGSSRLDGGRTQAGSGGQADEDDFFEPSLDKRQLLRGGESAVAVEREREMQEIFQSVQDLAVIMKDLSTLVIDQGTIVDRIDYNIQQTSDKVKKGVEQLEKAEKSQKRSALIACILCMVVACLILFAMLLVKKLFFLL